MEIESKDATAESSTATGGATDQSAQGAAAEVSPASLEGAQGDSPAPKTELEEFKAAVATATGKEPAKPAESKTQGEEAAPEATDESEAAGQTEGEETENQHEEDLSQDEKDQAEQAQAEGEGESAPARNDQRPEWKALTHIADKLGPTAGKEARKVLRGMFKRESELQQSIAKIQPSVEIVNELFESVGSDAGAFNNMRNVITTFAHDPARAVPMLEKLVADAKSRAGMVLQSPELLTEAQELDQQVAEGIITKAAADKRKAELLELESARSGQKRTQQQIDQEKQRAEQTKAQATRQTQVKALVDAGNAWEKETAGKDPDYAKVKSQRAAKRSSSGVPAESGRARARRMRYHSLNV
jgi:hypothetical protein